MPDLMDNMHRIQFGWCSTQTTPGELTALHQTARWMLALIYDMGLTEGRRNEDKWVELNLLVQSDASEIHSLQML